MSAALASNITGDQITFSQNVAFFGVGNDVGVLEGQGLLQNSIYLSNSVFYGSTDYEALTITMLRKAAQVCTWAQTFLHKVRPGSVHGLPGLRMTESNMAHAEKERTKRNGHGQHHKQHHHDDNNAQSQQSRRQLRGRRDFSHESRREQLMDASHTHGVRHSQLHGHGHKKAPKAATLGGLLRLALTSPLNGIILPCSSTPGL